MSGSVRSISLETARRLAILKQHLSGPRPAADADGLLTVARSLRCIQLDPISAVARSHQLVAFSRLGPYDPAIYDHLLFRDKMLFEYWAHAASIVLMEDYPIHSVTMRKYVRGESAWERHVREWMHTNQDLHDGILREITVHGPRLSRQLGLDGQHPEGWVSTGWTSGRNVSRMLDFLWMRGELMVAGRSGGQKLWDLSSRFLPEGLDRTELASEQATELAIEHAVRALGVAKTQHIKKHFIRGRYVHYTSALENLEAAGTLQRAHVHGHHAGLRGTWYLHASDGPVVDALERGEWQPRTMLLSPFDNLICDRERTQAMWDYDFRIEIYVPKDKRKYGYYVLSLLDGDRLIGRIDPAFQKREHRLDVQAFHLEPGAPDDRETAGRGADAIRELATFLGARQIVFGGLEGLPQAWKQELGSL